MGTRRKPVNIENIYILKGTQIGNIELKRGIYLAPKQVFAVDHKYTSVEKDATGEPVKYKINEADAAKLILENQAVAAKKAGSKWVAIDIFGDVIKDGPAIIIQKEEGLEKAKVV